MNFDVTKKVDAIKDDVSSDDELEDLDEYDEEGMDFEESEDSNNKPSSNNKKDLKKKMIVLMVIIGGGMLLLLLVLFIISRFSTRTYSYERVESIMKTAAESYFAENKENLPQDEKQLVQIEVANLVSAGKMKSLQEYLGEGTQCSGKVEVKKSGSTYVYTPYLSCGDLYSTKFLVDTIIDEKNLVGTGYGLYLMNNSYVFRGEKVNNYIKMEGSTWRIVKVNSDKTITIVLNKAIGSAYPFDDRYNENSEYDSGINNFASSRIKEQLDTMYNLDDKTEEYYILSEKDRTHLVPYDLCIGKMSTKNNIYDNSVECSQTMQSKIGLLTVSDYMNASIDTGCKTISNATCQNYNYLAENNYYWLITGNSENSYNTFNVSGNIIKTRITSLYSKIKPVVTLASNTLIESGTGTEEDPYIIK